jgi:hypothetical protein
MDPLTDIRTWEHIADLYHVNWALHIPDEYIDEFENRLPKWIEKSIGHVSEEDYKITNVYNLNGLMRYMLKGTLQSHAHRFDIRPSPQGEVWGRRAVAATCLGRVAREKDYSDGIVSK